MNKRVSFNYSGASVLVTGGSNGIGLAIAREYLAAGASVMITGRREGASDYEHDLSGLDYRQLDVSSRDALIELANSLDTLDILINNAGGAQADGRISIGGRPAATPGAREICGEVRKGGGRWKEIASVSLL